MKKVKYPIKFLCKSKGYKFEATCEVENCNNDYCYGLGNTLKEVTEDLIITLKCYTPYTWKCIEKPKPHLIKIK